MIEKEYYKFGIKVDKQIKGAWSFGICFSHSFGETYLFINFAKWSIAIGRLLDESEEKE